jgi:hypothetical protein
MESEPEKRPDGTYRWNLRAGLEYPLGYHHGHIAGIGMSGLEQVKATYFGILKKKHVFFREKDGIVLRYECQINAAVGWLGGEDEPCIPYVVSTYEREMPEGSEKQFVLEQLLKYKKLHL